MKNKGFVLMETIVVIVVISVALLTIFSSYNKILRKVKSENKYDTSEYIYMTEYIKKYMKDNGIGSALDIFPCTMDGAGNVTSCSTFTVTNYLDALNTSVPTISRFDVKKIHILTNINKFDKTLDNGKKNSEYFDAYMIDYIRKLDVGDSDELIIVEFGRPILKTDGEQKKDSLGNYLFETYIASLEW